MLSRPMISVGEETHRRWTQAVVCVPIQSVQYSIVFFFVFSDAEEIALLEPLGVAHNGVEKLKVKDEDVLVIGCGPMGLLVQMLAKVMGAKR